ncbi:hypothetical protein SAMN04487785_10681 [Dyella jiangningensis]|uniref:hypothetical protein n=1 Tax=Dyella sp. AtDHG13 TaxID=1938897 RepID=UPI0008818D97|nr:hypothetical protein [Dyella sp. AtDHG13]PXV59161.1 hypothetical protein BDW41_104206 [Dyella sp. AtDHG13]SDK24416.1 hypothetical protein SAMN04487785_10681 [Dyella jiangningensis]
MGTGASTPTWSTIEFYADRRSNMMIGMGCAFIVAALVLAANFGGAGIGGFVTVSIAFIAIGAFRRSSVYLRFAADHFETKLALAAGWHSVLYSEVTGCEVSDKLVIVYYRRHDQHIDAKPERIRIPLAELRRDDLPQCLDAFRTRLPPPASP